MNKIYLIVFDTTPLFDGIRLHNHISSLYPAYIKDWWHYLHSAYLVASPLSIEALYNLVFPGMPGHHFLIIEVDPKNYFGWLPSSAWDWFKKQ